MSIILIYDGFMLVVEQKTLKRINQADDSEEFFYVLLNNNEKRNIAWP